MVVVTVKPAGTFAHIPESEKPLDKFGIQISLLLVLIPLYAGDLGGNNKKGIVGTLLSNIYI
jgi:hypothetical protein